MRTTRDVQFYASFMKVVKVQNGIFRAKKNSIRKVLSFSKTLDETNCFPRAC